MLKGFKDFLLRGNVIDLAVAVIIGASFGAVVKTFTDMIMDVIGKFGGIPDFSSESIYGIRVGAFLSAVLAFVVTGAIVYFLIVAPLNRLAALGKKVEPEVSAPTVEELLVEIRDLLATERVPAGDATTDVLAVDPPAPQPPTPDTPPAPNARA